MTAVYVWRLRDMIDAPIFMLAGDLQVGRERVFGRGKLMSAFTFSHPKAASQVTAPYRTFGRALGRVCSWRRRNLTRPAISAHSTGLRLANPSANDRSTSASNGIAHC